MGKLKQIEAIRQLKYRYLRCLDCKLWDEMREVFSDDAVSHYDHGRYFFEGPDAIIGSLRDTLDRPGVISLHQVSLARRYCTRVLALRDGELIYDGPSAALTASFLQQLYGTAAEELLHDDHDFAAPPAEAPPLALVA